jgi:ubiquinone/menaquinone biosynthesis C-methylase UbiE
MALNKKQIKDLYRKRAGRYNLSANAYYLIGFREVKYRKLAVSKLQLKPGDTVVEIGCGTGLNFPYLLDAIGQTGRLIGIDLTDAMLEKAKERVRRNGWSNVELAQTDAAAFGFPAGIDGAISTFALTLVPEYEEVIKRVSRALNPGARLVIADFKEPDRWPMWIVRAGVLLTKPFGVSLDLAERKPWEVMRKYFSNVETTEAYGGFVYVAAGENGLNRSFP